MLDELIRKEEETAPELMLLLYLKCLTTIPCDVLFIVSSRSNPRWINGQVQISELLVIHEGCPSRRVCSLYQVESQEVVIVSVLLSIQLELRMEDVLCHHWAQAQVLVFKLSSLQ